MESLSRYGFRFEEKDDVSFYANNPSSTGYLSQSQPAYYAMSGAYETWRDVFWLMGAMQGLWENEALTTNPEYTGANSIYVVKDKIEATGWWRSQGFSRRFLKIIKGCDESL